MAASSGRALPKTRAAILHVRIARSPGRRIEPGEYIVGDKA